MQSSLEQSIKLGLTSIFNKLLSSNLDQDTTNYLLSTSIEYNRADIAKTLLKYAADANFVITEPARKLSKAIERRNTDMAGLFLGDEDGLSLCASNPWVLRSILERPSVKMIQFLFDQGVNFQAFISSQDIPWKLISMSDDQNIVMPLFVEQGLTQTTIDNSISASLRHAISGSRVDMLTKLLSDNIHVNRQILNNVDPISLINTHYSVLLIIGDLVMYQDRPTIKETLQVLVNYGFDPVLNNSRLYATDLIRSGDTELMQMYLHAGINVNERLSNNNTLLMQAARGWSGGNGKDAIGRRGGCYLGEQ